MRSVQSISHHPRASRCSTGRRTPQFASRGSPSCRHGPPRTSRTAIRPATAYVPSRKAHQHARVKDDTPRRLPHRDGSSACAGSVSNGMSGSGSGKTTLTVMTVENEWDKKTIQAVEETLG
ncbi:hypothetical protein STRIP9103_02331 [Streptomyces ipomoeae 91-03]|uniref:Uncharacterized protein n=1 Tax=Streptomyces ipomoeae 91-03 TaxID=698759 RepID=L1KL55_9ACTN|nr:hypothetical protein STRIP9103_02331 [Streptomyces ipomoeae 91-03]